MQKLKLHSKDLTAENIEKLAALFPNCVTESKAEDGSLKNAIDFDLLRQELSADLVEGAQERYRLDWPGKREALATANAPIAKTLKPCRGESLDFDETKNLYIEGDNLDALKLLQETYLNKVKMIYIDPPYNTGHDFVYEDDFKESSEEYFERSNQIDEEGNRMAANTDSNGRFHSDWLSMIYPRLKLARNLLAEDGVVFISIDDNEITNLKKSCDQIFGEQNFIATLVWEKGRKNDAKLFSLGHDYIAIYAKSSQCLKDKQVHWREVKPGAIEIQEEFLRLKDKYDNDFEIIQKHLRCFYRELSRDHPSKALSRYNKVDQFGVWRDDNMSWPGGGGPNYDVLHPITKEVCAVPPGGWRYSTLRAMNVAIEKGKVEFRLDHTEPPIRKTYLVASGDNNKDAVGLQVAGTYFYRSAIQASNVMDDLFGIRIFDSPKDHEILGRFIRYIGCGDNDIILDFFSGSATTAHAVMKLNAEDGGNRRHIMVQLPEACDEKSTAFKAGYTTIAEIGKERIRRAGAKIRDELESQLEGELLKSDKHQEITAKLANLDTGFRVLKVDSSNMADVYYQPDEVTQDGLDLQVENIKPDRSPEDLLFQVLIDWGVDLSLEIKNVKLGVKNTKGKPYTIFMVDDNALLACFDSGITEEVVQEMAKLQPLRAVFRDASFTNDATKINIEQIFKLISPHTELRTL